MGITLFIVGIIVFVIGIAVWRRFRAEGDTGIATVGLIVGVLLGGGLVVSSCVTVVDARAVGIQTSFGRYHDSLGSGMQVTAPWSSVTEWTTRNQTIRFAGDGKAEERDNYLTEPRITVRLANQSEAYVDAIVTWQVTEASVKGLWQQYKSFEDVRRDFAIPQAQTATYATFESYNPFTGLDAQNADNPYISVEEWSKRVTAKLRPLYDARSVVLVTVLITNVEYDQETQSKIKAFAAEVANTRIKTQEVKTAEQEALASKARAAQSAPGCEALIRDLAAKDQLKNLPAGWQCPGTSGPAVVGTNR